MNLVKSDRIVCKICKQSVACRGGMSNLQTQLQTSHSPVYNKHSPSNNPGVSGNSGKKNKKVDSFFLTFYCKQKVTVGFTFFL